MSEQRAPHDGAQSQVDDEQKGASTADASTPTAPPPPVATQPAIAAPGKPDGEVDTRR